MKYFIFYQIYGKQNLVKNKIFHRALICFFLILKKKMLFNIVSFRI